jgi:protein-disulfide isomerase
MRRRISGAVLGALLLGAALAVPAAGQETSTDDLKKDIQALQESLESIQKDLREIKGMLARQAPRPSGVGAVIDIADNPVKGESTAKLTMVEFSDYQ